MRRAEICKSSPNNPKCYGSNTVANTIPVNQGEPVSTNKDQYSQSISETSSQSSYQSLPPPPHDPKYGAPPMSQNDYVGVPGHEFSYTAPPPMVQTPEQNPMISYGPYPSLPSDTGNQQTPPPPYETVNTSPSAPPYNTMQQGGRKSKYTHRRRRSDSSRTKKNYVNHRNQYY